MLGDRFVHVSLRPACCVVAYGHTDIGQWHMERAIGNCMLCSYSPAVQADDSITPLLCSYENVIHPNSEKKFTHFI